MADFYFSFSSGSDSTGDGSIGNPWKTFYANKSGSDALNPDDNCYFKAGDTWIGWPHCLVQVDSNGTAGHPITINRYGAGADPLFRYSPQQSTWTDSGANNVWTKSGLYAFPATVGVDETYALCRFTGTDLSGGTTQVPGTFKTNGSGTTSIRLADNSDPNTHSIYHPSGSNTPSNFRGLIGSSLDKGSYISINNIHVMYADGKGFSLSQPNSEINNCTATGCGGDGFFLVGQTTQGEMANDCMVNYCTATYCNAYGTGLGQAYTTGAYNTWFNWCIATNNFMAGFDFLDYDSTNTDVYNSGCTYCTATNNGLWTSNPSYDANIYIDGAHDILIYGCIAGGGNGVNSQNSISVSSEHQDRPVYNIHLVNNLAYNSLGYNIQISQGGDFPDYNNGDPVYGCTVVNNTMVRLSNSGYGACFNTGSLGTSVKTIIKNNIFYNSASSHALRWISSITSSTCDMDYNCYYDPNKSAVFSDGDSTPNYTLAQWQSNRSLDSNSIQADPKLISTVTASIDVHVTQATSPCVGSATTTPWTPPAWVATAGVLQNNGAVVGTTDPSGTPDVGPQDMGYHYYVASSNINSTRNVFSNSKITIPIGMKVTLQETAAA